MITTHPTVRQVMTKKLVTAGEDATFKELAWLMKSHSISAVPIVDKAGQLVGIVSEADLLVKEQHAGGELPEPHWLFEADRAEGLVAADLMTSPVMTIGGSDSIAKAARTMQEFGVRHLVVVTGKGRPAGLISRSDLLGVFLRPDAEIREQVVYGVIDEMLSLDPAAFKVEVRDGVVSMAGEVPDWATQELLVSIVKRLPAVIGVHEKLRVAAGSGARQRAGAAAGAGASGGWPYEPPPNVDEDAGR